MREKVAFQKPSKPKGNEFYYTVGGDYYDTDKEKNKRISCEIKLSPKKKVERFEIKLHDYSNVDMEIIIKQVFQHNEAEELLKFFDRVLWAIADPK